MRSGDPRVVGAVVFLLVAAVLLWALLPRERPVSPDRGPGRGRAALVPPPLFEPGIVDPSPYTKAELRGPDDAPWWIFSLSDETLDAVQAGTAFSASLSIEGKTAIWTFGAPTARADGYDWAGTSAGEVRGTVTLVSMNASPPDIVLPSLLANLWTSDGRTFELSALRAGEAYVLRALPRLDARCPGGVAVDRTRETQPGLAPHRLDLVIAYTLAAERVVAPTATPGGFAARFAVFRTGYKAVAATNQALRRSKIEDVTVRVVGWVRIDESDDEKDLAILMKEIKSKGRFQAAWEKWSDVGADLLTLLVASPNAGDAGLGHQGGPFSVVKIARAHATLSLAHEIGHNLTCCHELLEDCKKPHEKYAHGKVSTGDVMTIMATDPFKTRDLNYSNPDVDFDSGGRTGSEDENNAEAIRGYAPTAQQWNGQGP